MAREKVKHQCPECKNERVITYSQSWNIRVGKSSGKCQKCTIPLNGAKNQFKKGVSSWNKRMIGYGKWAKWFPVDEKNPAWKGDFCSHEAMHQWLYRRLGKARKCEYCGFEGRCHWANLKNHEYHKDINDYISLCPFCHKNYDLGRIKL